MAREYRWLAALHPVFPLAPRPYVLCEDTSIIGSVFYVMERRRGIVVRHDEPLGLANRPDERRRVSEAIVDTLADLHAIDVANGPLATLGKPAGFVARQVRGWTERWEQSKTTELPEMEALATWLAARIPTDLDRAFGGARRLQARQRAPRSARPWSRGGRVRLGDERTGRPARRSRDPAGVLVADGAARTTRRADDGDEPARLSDPRGDHRPLRARSGRDVSTIRFYETFALFKIAVVIQQIFFRYSRGQTDDQRFANFGERVTYLARAAALLAGRT